MDKITKVSPLTEPHFIQPMLLDYTHNGKAGKWEAVKVHDSVSILLWHRDKNAFVLVKQLRPAILNANPNNGYMYELCAGIIDKNIPDIEIAKEEIFEECGYDVPIQNLQKVSTFFTSVGISGSKQTLYYAKIDESMKVSDGGGLEEEEIEVVYLDVADAREFMFDESFQKTPGMFMAFYWFFENQIK